jgi:uncharacterized protein YggE
MGRTLARAGVVAAPLLLTLSCGTGPTYLSGGLSTSLTPTTSAPDSKTVTVQAVGIATGVPESVLLTLAIETIAATTAEALDTVSNKSKALTSYLLDAGVAADDLQTTSLSLYPAYDYTDPTLQPSITGYQASMTVTALVESVDLAATIIDGAATAVGDALRIYGLSFAITDREAVIAEARADAIVQAQAQAEQLASAAGLQLGDIVSIAEGASDISYPFPRASDGGDASLNPGTQTLQVYVTVVFSATT